jgi:hypothetical protein
MSEEKVEIGTTGIALEHIDAGETGEAYIPALKKRVRVYAVEEIRKNRDIIIVGANNSAQEHTPTELKYETWQQTWERVGEPHPLPVTMGSKSIIYTTVKVTASGNTPLVTPNAGKKIRVHWYAYSNKDSSLADVGMRFGEDGEIKHRFALAAEGGNVISNLTDANWEGAVSETLYAFMVEPHPAGVYFTIGYTLEEEK